MIKNEVYSCFSKAFLLVALLCCISTEAFAYNFSAKNSDEVTIYYNRITNSVTDETEAEVTFGEDNYYSGVVKIPNTVKDTEGNELSVTSIGRGAFGYCYDLTEVTIPNSVTSIGEYAFMNCSSLTSVTIPNSVTSIGQSVFAYCSSLASVTIPYSVKSIGDYVFTYCSSLASVTIGKSVTSIGFGAFQNCSSLKEVILLRDNLPDCGGYAFDGISGEATLYYSIGLGTTFDEGSPWLSFKTIEASVVSLDKGERLSKYITNDNKSTITKLRVCGEINSEDIALLKEMATDGTLSVLDLSGATAKEEGLIGSYAFSGCTKLTSISLPQKVTSIGVSAFSGCTSLTSIIIPSSVTSISNYAFSGCTSLTSITIPSSVTNIGDVVFGGCYGLTSIEVEEGNISYYIDSNCLIEKASNKLIRGCNLASIAIPDNVTSIGDGAFNDCSSLESVTIPDNVTSIGEEAFDACSSLTSVTIPNSVTSIGVYAFHNCSGLTSVTIPNSVTNIEYETFSSCSKLTSITIPNSVENIGEAAFYDCSSLNKVVLLGDDLPKCDSYAFYNISANATLYCKKSLVASCTEDSWKGFKSVEPLPYIEIPEVGYATGCFDFDLDFTSLGDDVAAYIASAFSPTESTVLLTRAKKIPAKTGFIVHGKAGTYDIPVASTDYVYSNMLVGVLEATTVAQTEGDYTNYVLRQKTDGSVVAFLIADEDAISANRAYLQIPTSKVSTDGTTSNAKTSLSLSFDDDEDDGTTGISEIKEQSNRTSGTTVIYNLNGQRKQSLTKGLNIVNGKKIFIK